jgi:hypothetical protein
MNARENLLRDLSLHLQQEVGNLMQSHVDRAQMVLSKADIMFMLINLAAMVTKSGAASLAAEADTAEGQATGFDIFVTSVRGFVDADRAKSLAKVAEVARPPRSVRGGVSQ